MKTWIAAGLIALAPLEAQAGAFYSGNQLYNFMTSGNRFENQVALGYVAGVVDAEDRSRSIRGVCFQIPAQVTGDQVRDVVKRFLEQNPALRHFNAANLSASALSDAFPCPN